MIISWDIDAVTLASEITFLEYIKEVYGKEHTTADIDDWYWYGNNYPKVLDLFKNPNLYEFTPMINGMDKVFEESIKKYGYQNQQFVTSTHEAVRVSKENRMEQLFHHIIDFDKINMVHVGLMDDEKDSHHKYDYTKGTILIDDAIHNIDDHVVKNEDPGLLIDYNYGWNQNYEHDLVKRIKDKNQILTTIDKLLG